MSKEELFKKYQEIVLKTNGGADDYVVALCQISNLIKDYAEEKDQQIADLETKLAESEKERELDNSFWKQECDSLQKTLAEKDKEIEYQESMKILAVENQNKKAIEQLEKVKEEMDLRPRGVSKGWKNKEYDTLVEEDVYEVIDNQIKQLKEGK